MKKTVAIFIAAMAISGSAFAQGAISSSTTRWTDADGNLIREYTTVKQYKSIDDARFDAKVGAELPATYSTTYELPNTITIEHPDRYRYVVVNGQPIIVERENRKIIHVYPR